MPVFKNLCEDNSHFNNSISINHNFLSEDQDLVKKGAYRITKFKIEMLSILLNNNSFV